MYVWSSRRVQNTDRWDSGPTKPLESYSFVSSVETFVSFSHLEEDKSDSQDYGSSPRP